MEDHRRLVADQRAVTNFMSKFGEIAVGGVARGCLDEYSQPDLPQK
jgi:hypothetical protein